jgi:hypothetical protein
MELPDNIANEAPHTQVTHESTLSDADRLIAYAKQQPTSESEMRVLHSFRRIIQKGLAEFRRHRAQQTLNTWIN